MGVETYKKYMKFKIIIFKINKYFEATDRKHIQNLNQERAVPCNPEVKNKQEFTSATGVTSLAGSLLPTQQSENPPQISTLEA